MLEGVTIEQLRTLRAVAAAGSFSAAARKLGRVQAAVSQSIDRLEAQLGLRLFDRSGRVPRLTQHGEAVVAAAARIEGGVEALDELVASLKRGEETTLRIVVDVMFPTDSLVAFAQGVRRRAPVGRARALHRGALGGDRARSREAIDLGDRHRGRRHDRPRSAGHRRRAPRAGRGAGARARAAQRGRSTRRGSSDAVQIVLGEHRHEAERGSDDHGVLSPRTWRVVDLATKHALIASGLGWGHMPEHLVRDDLRAGRLVALELEAWGQHALRRSLVLVRRRDVVMGPVAKWAQGRLGELCRRNVEPDARRAHHRSDGWHHARPQFSPARRRLP